MKIMIMGFSVLTANVVQVLADEASCVSESGPISPRSLRRASGCVLKHTRLCFLVLDNDIS
jgi:hypothetical protein